MTKTEAASLVAMAVASYPGMQEKNLGPVAQVWMEMLADMPFVLAKQAILKHIATEKFFPTVAEIRKQAESLTQKKRVLASEEAWEEVMIKINNPSKEYSSPLIKRAVDAVGGLHIIGYTDMSELGVVRAHFMRTYDAYIRCEKEDEEVMTFRNLLEQIERKKIGG